MRKKLKGALTGAAILGVGFALMGAGCTQASTEDTNLSKQADNFQIERTIILQDDVTGTITQELTGRCSIDPNSTDSGREHTVTCKIGNGKFVKEIFIVGDNSTLTSMQVNPISGNPYAMKFIIKPTTIDFDLQTPNHDAGGN